jgi:hypothetical protein
MNRPKHCKNGGTVRPALPCSLCYGRKPRAQARFGCCSSSVVEHSLGKGEVESSILSCSTINSKYLAETYLSNSVLCPTRDLHNRDFRPLFDDCRRPVAIMRPGQRGCRTRGSGFRRSTRRAASRSARGIVLRGAVLRCCVAALLLGQGKPYPPIPCPRRQEFHVIDRLFLTRQNPKPLESLY